MKTVNAGCSRPCCARVHLDTTAKIQSRVHSERSESRVLRDAVLRKPLNWLQIELPSYYEALRCAQGDNLWDGDSAQMRSLRTAA